MRRHLALSSLIFVLASPLCAQLLATYQSGLEHYNKGIDLVRSKSYQAAIEEFSQSAAVDPSKNSVLAWLVYMSNARIAEAHYQMGADLYNKRDRIGANSHFDAAVKAVGKAIEVASSVTPPASIEATNGERIPPDLAREIAKRIGHSPSEIRAMLNKDLLFCYEIYAKNIKILVEYYGESNRIDDAIKAMDQAEALDRNKAKWKALKTELLRLAGRRPSQ